MNCWKDLRKLASINNVAFDYFIAELLGCVIDKVAMKKCYRF